MMIIIETWLHLLIPDAAVQLAGCISYWQERSRDLVRAKENGFTIKMTGVLIAGLLLDTAVLILKPSQCHVGLSFYPERESVGTVTAVDIPQC